MNINVTDALGNTALHYASKKGIAKLLILHGASLMIQNIEGLNPLQYYMKYVDTDTQDLKYIAFLSESYENERKGRFMNDVIEIKSIHSTLIA